METGTAKKETRGGSRNEDVYTEIRQSIIAFIKTLRCTGSHYGRGESTRQYLPPPLTITYLWRLWQSDRVFRQNADAASRSTFAEVFRSCFNLAFKHPKVDVCSF